MEWTLGVLREHTQHQVRTEFDREQETHPGPELLRSPLCRLDRVPRDDRAGDRVYRQPPRFPGTERHARSPGRRFAPRASWAGSAGAGIDPCAALQCVVDLEPGETREIAILLGACDSEASARKALAHYKDLERAKSSIERTVEQWDERLSVVR